MMVQFKIISVLIFLINICIIIGKECNGTDLVSQQCTENETCLIKTKLCECLPKFKRINGRCESITKESTSTESSALTNESNGDNILVGILIPLFVLFVVIIGAYISKKYQVIFWIRSKFNKRNNNYDEVMIGQEDDDDDLPLQD